MTHIVVQAFGADNADLYKDVLNTAKGSSLAKLRKAYYQQALRFHPDKNNSDNAKLKFQAISWTYQLLKDQDKRAQYDRDGTLPYDDEDFEGGEDNHWKFYFDRIFGKVSVSKIDEFAAKYKMGEEEEKDVLMNYEKFNGNLIKCLEYVMLSEARDVQRWFEDYIKPAIDSGRVVDYSDTLSKTLHQIKKKADKENEIRTKDPDETETEGSEDACPDQRSESRKKRVGPMKEKPNSKKKSAKISDDDLVAAIRQRSNQTNPLAALGNRYGGSLDADDPLDDETFARLQSKYKRK